MQPSSGTLLEVVDVLNDYNVENVILKMGMDDLYRLESPITAQLTRPKKKFVVITSLKESEVTYLSEGNRVKTVSHEIFSNEWSGVVLIGAKYATTNFKRISI